MDGADGKWGERERANKMWGKGVTDSPPIDENLGSYILFHQRSFFLTSRG
jgi:hypothetical protein